jgi:cardiolipin synthase C
VARAVTPTVVLALLSACAVNPATYPRTPSTRMVAADTCVLAKVLAPPPETAASHSGFVLLSDPQPAFEARAALAAAAEQTLDLQYYIWQPDTAGTLMAVKLAQAAKRGVRVRVLIDDFTTSGHDMNLALLNSLPNVEVRLFNPYGSRGGRGMQMMGDFSRLNHRMHNKAMIADGRAAIVGGRNVGDHYYGVSGEANFRDMDVLATGPVVADIAASFDDFWNSDFAVPVEALGLAKQEKVAKRYERAETRSSEWQEKNAKAISVLLPAGHDLKERLRTWGSNMTWGEGRVLVDDPSKVAGSGEMTVAKELGARANATQHELLIESAYFVPGDRTIESFGEMVGRGIKVRVLTNSLASTDVSAVHAVYAPKRKPLLDKGVELHEFRIDSRGSALLGSSGASLHSKVVVFDRSSVFIGSFNLDGRSAIQNTELGILIDSPELAAHTAAVIEKDLQPETSWKVIFDPTGDKLRWLGRTNGEADERTHEPGASVWRRMSASMLGWLPESQM